ncbi:MAG: polysaccharide pyruvyl transferase family protein [Bacteroidales bacterium]|jgi:hypothetical protein|nr:polysaccharide pyruvyl transferase family protein [Bacteroidales bacterium]
MKIGLLTIFNVPNYGALLQCYALSEYLRQLGHDVFLYNIPLSDVDRFVYRIKKRVKLNFMSDFHEKYLPRSTRDLTKQADLYMIGSDQVWNPEITGDKAFKYMFSFVGKGAKKVSYGASFGVSQWRKYSNMNEDVQKLLNDFSYITVRENSGVKLLQEIFNIDSCCVLDPCFLFDRYNDLIIEKEIFIKNQLTTYKLLYSYDWYCNIKKLSKNLNCSLFELSPRILKRFDSIRGFNVKNYTVHEWLYNIAVAKYVITDSYHGCVFSILFQKQFVLLKGHKNRFTRLESLLSDLDLTYRIANSVSDCKEILSIPIDYDKTNIILDKLKKYSKDQLLHMLEI